MATFVTLYFEHFPWVSFNNNFNFESVMDTIFTDCKSGYR